MESQNSCKGTQFWSPHEETPEISMNEGNTPEVGLLGNSHSQSRLNQRSQITSTRKITSSTGKEATIIVWESDRTSRWIREAVKIRQEGRDVMHGDEGAFRLFHVYDDLLSAATVRP